LRFAFVGLRPRGRQDACPALKKQMRPPFVGGEWS